MQTFNGLKTDILKVSTDLLKLFEAVSTGTGMSEKNFDYWKSACGHIQAQLPDEIMRVAAVGPIKSGKSTFVNTLFHGDYLKRGAGVVTSIVTRIRRGPGLKAILYFKSWDEINQEMQQAISFFPSLQNEDADRAFDIRRAADREQVAGAMESLDSDQLISSGTRNVNSVILSSYLKGYAAVSDIVSPEVVQQVYAGERFAEHRKFSGDEVLAVYVKDIQLEIDTGDLEENIEIADCQGSDSSNPLHMTMIQDYLLLANMLVYVISSRTGIRQADIRFLSMIRKMGIMENIIFIVNCDFSEHETLEGMVALIDRIRSEVSIFKPDPDLFAFSALFSLLRHQAASGEIHPRDRKRLEYWSAENELVAFSNREFERFAKFFREKITTERYGLLLRNHVKRLEVISSGVLQWSKLNQEIIAGDEKSAGKILKDIRKNQEKMNRIKSMVQNTLDGCSHRAKAQLRKDADAFFENRSGEVVPEITRFIEQYAIPFDRYETILEEKGFTETLHSIYQEFKQALDEMMVAQINPRIMGFMKAEERKIAESFEEVSRPFDYMVRDALAGYEETLGHYDIPLPEKAEETPSAPDMESVKKRSGLRIPPAALVMRYSARVKTEAVLRFGFYKLLTVFKRILRKPVGERQDDQHQALKDGMRRMKRETEASIVFHFKNYRENSKFQYLFKLVDAVAAHSFEALLDRFQAYHTDLIELTQLIDGKRIDKERVFALLKEAETASMDIHQRIEAVNHALARIAGRA